MNCKTVHKNLIFYLEGSLPEKEMKEVETHLQECSECSSFAREMESTLSVIEKEKSPDVSPYFYTRMKARMEKEAGPAYKQLTVFRRIIQPAMFSLLLLVGIYSGIKIGQVPFSNKTAQATEEEMVPYLNEMSDEPIETFLMK